MSLQKHLVIFAKAPRMGLVKTRLARDIGGVRAWGFYRHALAGLVQRLSSDPRWQTYLAVAPDTACEHTGVWPAGASRFPKVSEIWVTACIVLLSGCNRGQLSSSVRIFQIFNLIIFMAPSKSLAITMQFLVPPTMEDTGWLGKNVSQEPGQFFRMFAGQVRMLLRTLVRICLVHVLDTWKR